ncbi:MAG: ATP:cob(I)alamin adenosyltransferase [Prolixibacteraceae bacterium]|nr:ATP:cob(I)alamin adenosyltransferase [Prolixibacteraceae bacterium]
MQNALPPLSNFILPGGSLPASYCHIARTVCRRAERRVVALNNFIENESPLVVFINRLSDYLFALSRFINFKSGRSETTWHAGE